MFATNRHPGPVRPRHPSTSQLRRRRTGSRATQRSIARAAQPPSMPAHPGCLGCFGCFRGGADWVLSLSDASPNSHLRQTCFDSVRTLQESCLSSQSEASQLFITSRLRRQLPKPYRPQSLSSLSSPLPTSRTSASASALTIPPLIEPSNSSKQPSRNLISVITAITPSRPIDPTPPDSLAKTTHNRRNG